MRSFFKHLLKALAILVAFVWFVVDVLVLVIVDPVVRWFVRLALVARLRRWIEARDRYTSALLFAVPAVVFSPVKPIGFYLIARGNFVAGTGLIVLGGLLKMTVLDFLWKLTKPKLLTFGLVAWIYGRLEGLLAWAKATYLYRRMTFIMWRLRRYGRRCLLRARAVARRWRDALKQFAET